MKVLDTLQPLPLVLLGVLLCHGVTFVGAHADHPRPPAAAPGAPPAPAVRPPQLLRGRPPCSEGRHGAHSALAHARGAAIARRRTLRERRGAFGLPSRYRTAAPPPPRRIAAFHHAFCRIGYIRRRTSLTIYLRFFKRPQGAQSGCMALVPSWQPDPSWSASAPELRPRVRCVHLLTLDSLCIY